MPIVMINGWFGAINSDTQASKSFSAATLTRVDNASAIGATASSGGLPGT
jgi:hypothetical protein